MYQHRKSAIYNIRWCKNEFYVTQPKLRRIEKSKYIDRIVHRWIVDNFLNEYFIKTFIDTTYACIKNRGMHKACSDVQNAITNKQIISTADIKMEIV